MRDKPVQLLDAWKLAMYRNDMLGGSWRRLKSNMLLGRLYSWTPWTLSTGSRGDKPHSNTVSGNLNQEAGTYEALS